MPTRKPGGAPRKPASITLPIRMPVTLKQSLEALAKREGRSRNNMAVRLLASGVVQSVQILVEREP